MNRRPSMSFAVKAALVVCAVGVAFHGATKNGGGRRSAKAHGDEASSLVAATEPTFADRKIHQWNTCGAWKYDDATIDFADDFVFPWGTNRLTRINVVSQGRIQSTHRNTNAIANVGVALSMVPGVSRFAYEHTPSNTYRFAWSDAVVGRVALNAPQYETLYASIELFRNGDSVITTNGFARQVKYVNPYDLDGDGLANWIDPHPTVSDGDCFGTGVDWINLNCGGVLSATTNAHGGIVLNWKEGANPDAYYWLTFTSLADNNRITATCDGKSDLGDMEIIAKEGQECRIPLLIGAKYLIESTDGIGDVSVNDEYTVVYELVEGLKYEVILPLEISFERVGAAAQAQAARRRVAKVSASSGSSSMEWRLNVLPRDPGVKIVSVTGGCCDGEADGIAYLWTCGYGCHCGQSERDMIASVVWEGYTRSVSWTGSCPCRWNTPSSWLSLSVPDIVFLNSDDDDVNGEEDRNDEWVPRENDLRSVIATFNPPAPTNGTLTLKIAAGGGKVKTWGESLKSNEVSLPWTGDAGGFPGYAFLVEGVEVSGAQGDVRFAWEYAEENGRIHSVTQSLTVAEVKWLHMSSSVAGASPNPPPFPGQFYNPFYVNGSPNPARHLVVPFMNVAEPDSGFAVKDFAVDMRLELNPAVSVEGETAEWQSSDVSPTAGRIEIVDAFSARFVNPKVGGVYRISASYHGSPVTTGTIVLPLAGACVDSVFAEDLAAAERTAQYIISTTWNLERQTPWFGTQWFNDGGMGDYLGRVDSADKPTVWHYNQVNDMSGLGAVATWHGLPVRMAKLSNFMVGYATKRIGVWDVSRWLSQGSGTFNDDTASMSWDAGEAVADGANVAATTAAFVTNSWKKTDVKVRTLWPNPAPTDNHVHSSQLRDYNLDFRSPGFIERGKSYE